MRERDSSPPNLASWEKPSGKVRLLSMVDMFRDLSKEEIHDIQGMLNMVTFKKGRILYRPEEQAEVLFLLKKGRIRLYALTAEGKRLLIDTISPGTFFGEMPLTDQSMHQVFAEAVEDSLVCVLSRGDLERLIIRKPQVALRLLERLSGRLEEMRAKLEEVSLKDATTRVCRALLRLSDRSSESSAMTHQELADSTGLSRETVTNILNRLQALRLVQLARKKIAILSRKGLEESSQT